MNTKKNQNLEQLSKVLSKHAIQQTTKIKGGVVIEEEIEPS